MSRYDGQRGAKQQHHDAGTSDTTCRRPKTESVAAHVLARHLGAPWRGAMEIMSVCLWCGLAAETARWRCDGAMCSDSFSPTTPQNLRHQGLTVDILLYKDTMLLTQHRGLDTGAGLTGTRNRLVMVTIVVDC